MHGNVWEWCLDWYSEALSGGTETDPTGAASGTSRACRGGSWYYSSLSARTAKRDWNAPTWVSKDVGLRVALTRHL
jgi:formylglycine-generating enzyme required for sulfatase activity